MTPVEVNFVSVDSGRVVVATGRLWSEGFWLTTAHQVVQIEHIKVIECLFAVPATKNVELVGYGSLSN